MNEDIQEKSKTRVKKEAEELQKLGMALTRLPVQQLQSMDLPENLLNALIDFRSIRSHGAGKRQEQYIGALMREVDPEPIRQALVQPAAHPPSLEPEPAPEIQTWLERLLTGDSNDLAEFIGRFPELDHQRLRQLIRNAGKEKASGKSTKSMKSLEQMIETGLETSRNPMRQR